MSQPTPPPLDGQSPYSSQPAGQPAYGQQPPTGAYPSQYAGYGYAQPAQSTNTLAIVSLVMSIVGFFILPVIGSIVGVITGHIAKRQIAETGENGSGMATAGLIIGYVGGVIVLLLLAAAIFLPVLIAASAATY